MLYLLTAAFALDCTGRDAVLCPGVNDLVDYYAPEIIPEAKQVRIYDALKRASDRAACPADGVMFGTYHRGAWEGPHGSGTYGDHVFTGLWNGQALGDRWAAYNSQAQVGANLGVGRYAAGKFQRLRGASGVWALATGPCGSGFALDDNWFRGDLVRPLVVIQVGSSNAMGIRLDYGGPAGDPVPGFYTDNGVVQTVYPDRMGVEVALLDAGASVIRGADGNANLNKVITRMPEHLQTAADHGLTPTVVVVITSYDILNTNYTATYVPRFDTLLNTIAATTGVEPLAVWAESTHVWTKAGDPPAQAVVNQPRLNADMAAYPRAVVAPTQGIPRSTDGVHFLWKNDGMPQLGASVLQTVIDNY